MFMKKRLKYFALAALVLAIGYGFFCCYMSSVETDIANFLIESAN